jgi:hypothetical protein
MFKSCRNYSRGRQLRQNCGKRGHIWPKSDIVRNSAGASVALSKLMRKTVDKCAEKCRPITQVCDAYSTDSQVISWLQASPRAIAAARRSRMAGSSTGARIRPARARNRPARAARSPATASVARGASTAAKSVSSGRSGGGAAVLVGIWNAAGSGAQADSDRAKRTGMIAWANMVQTIVLSRCRVQGRGWPRSYRALRQNFPGVHPVVRIKRHLHLPHHRNGNRVLLPRHGRLL